MFGEPAVANTTNSRSLNKILELTCFRSRDILGLLDTLVDIGAFAEKEVIQ